MGDDDDCVPSCMELLQDVEDCLSALAVERSCGFIGKNALVVSMLDATQELLVRRVGIATVTLPRIGQISTQGGRIFRDGYRRWFTLLPRQLRYAVTHSFNIPHCTLLCGMTDFIIHLK